MQFIGRPTYVHVGALRSYHGFFLLSFALYNELAVRNSTIFGYMIGSKCNLKMHVQNLGYPRPLLIGGYIASKRHALWSPNGFKLDRHLGPTHPP